MNPKLDELHTSLIVENQLRTSGRLPRLLEARTDDEKNKRADAIVDRVLRAAAVKPASKGITEKRIEEVVESQFAVVGQPIMRVG